MYLTLIRPTRTLRLIHDHRREVQCQHRAVHLTYRSQVPMKRNLRVVRLRRYGTGHAISTVNQ